MNEADVAGVRILGFTAALVVTGLSIFVLLTFGKRIIRTVNRMVREKRVSESSSAAHASDRDSTG
jgi:hypothetical protein